MVVWFNTNNKNYKLKYEILRGKVRGIYRGEKNSYTHIWARNYWKHGVRFKTWVRDRGTVLGFPGAHGDPKPRGTLSGPIRSDFCYSGSRPAGGSGLVPRVPVGL